MQNRANKAPGQTRHIGVVAVVFSLALVLFGSILGVEREAGCARIPSTDARGFRNASATLKDQER